MYELHEVSNPYIDSVNVENGFTIITMGVDQMWVDPDTNETRVITEYYDRLYDE